MKLGIIAFATAACLGAADPTAWISDAGGVVTRDSQGRIVAIDLWAVSLTEPGLDALATLTNLRHLRLSGTIVSSRGLEKLKGLTKLERLDLQGCQRIGDEAIPVLAALPALHFVDLNSTSVTKRGLEALHQAKPDCSILSGDLNTSPRDTAEEPQ